MEEQLPEIRRMMMMISSRFCSQIVCFLFSLLVLACLGISRSHTKKTQNFGHLLKKDNTRIYKTNTHNIEKKDSFVRDICNFSFHHFSVGAISEPTKILSFETCIQSRKSTRSCVILHKQFVSTTTPYRIL